MTEQAGPGRYEGNGTLQRAALAERTDGNGFVTITNDDATTAEWDALVASVEVSE